MQEMTNGLDEIEVRNVCGYCGRELRDNEIFTESVYGDKICKECEMHYVVDEDTEKLCKESDIVYVYNDDGVEVKALYHHSEMLYDYYHCDICDKYYENPLNEDTHGNLVCSDCVENYNYLYCEDCGGLVDETEVIEIHGRNGYSKYVCDDCCTNYYICEDCGDYYETAEDMLRIHNGDLICNNCSESYYYCDNCGEYYHENEMNYDDDRDCSYCDSCYAERKSDYIYDYHEFQDWEFHKSTYEIANNITPDFYIGFENEVECGDAYEDCGTLAREVRQKYPVICSRDGSLDEGFEIVSHPLSYEWIMENSSMLKDMLDYLKNNCVKSHDTDTCGLHFHITRPSEEVIDRIWLLLETYKDELIKFSRRDLDKINEWSKFLTDTELTQNTDGEVVKSLYFIKKNKENTSRYMALNLQNNRTIEFRLFRGTLKFETFMASIELVNNIVKLCSDLSRDLKTITWDLITQTPYCKEYCFSKDIKTDKLIIDNTKLAKKLEEYDETYKSVVKKISREFFIEVATMNTKLYKRDIKNLEFKDIHGKFNELSYNMSKVSDLMYHISEFHNRLDSETSTCLYQLNKHMTYIEGRYIDSEIFNVKNIVKKYIEKYDKIRHEIYNGSKLIREGDDR